MHGKVLKCIGAAWNQYILKQNTHRKKEIKLKSNIFMIKVGKLSQYV